MALTIRVAEAADLDALMPLVREFYRYERLEFDDMRYRELAAVLMGDPSLGRILVVAEGDAIIGYAVITFGFSFEFGGRDALIDELYVREAVRGRGLGTRLLAAIEELCRAKEIRAVHLEADHFNIRVHEYYKRVGFRDHERHLMTKWLSGSAFDQEAGVGLDDDPDIGARLE
jgi:GNAT superfamily N-acetyltransferase